MDVIDKGHRYSLKKNGKNENCRNELVFYKDADINSDGYDGTTNQEVIRALIDRIKFLNKQKPCEYNREIVYHLRMALVLHEKRHLNRLVQENYPVENIKTGSYDHFTPNKSLWKKEDL